MDTLETLRAVVFIAETGSFSRAARELRVSPTAITRAIAQLENRLNTALFHRTTRAVTLTDEGALFLPRAKRVIEELAAAESEILGKAVEPSGQLAITAPVLYGRLHVIPAVAELRIRHPGLRVRALLLDRVVNLAEEGIDVAVRIGDLPDSALLAVRVGEVQQVLVASPSYLARRGTPQIPQDLEQHDIIAFSGLGTLNEWRFGDGSVSRGFSPVLEVNTADAAVEAAKSGMGIARLLSYQVRDQLEAGTLRTLLRERSTAPLPVHLVFPANRRSSPAVRAFIDIVKTTGSSMSDD
ncbi:LysR family transcriptional regulator [Pseudorhizobium endolithicum]|uniref:LysR family transcriptional regulator n=1 Tax=Pseudorhizobium endolithicum TaxID=1191678 RepID=A0ABN7JX92_9HYPH|nr:LysR family transcriptional regulator [Pseudorhizobium endolithicum]CAD7052705.1 LysR family transcriptional regulator [Pseudorhizobium endolithicum]